MFCQRLHTEICVWIGQHYIGVMYVFEVGDKIALVFILN